MSKLGWSSQDPNLIGLVNDYHAKCVEVYKRDPNRLEEDAGKESGIAEGGYGRKQIQELVQNAADALRGAPGRVQVTLNRDALYVANQGESFVDSGVRALLYTHLSNKTGGEIGRFGLGFKSISGISDGPQIFSQSVSFEFSRSETAHELSLELGENLGSVDVPALRLAWVLDPNKEFRADPILSDLAGWAVTIIKVPLKPDVAKQLSEEISDFDESFNLFAPHVKQLDLHDTIRGEVRRIAASKSGNKVLLSTEDGEREWLVFSAEHQPSSSALESAGRATRRDSITVSWAVPSTGKVGVGQLCAFFPVKSDVTLSGRINAPWKLSDDRINVIECEFNYEILTDVVPQLVVEARRDLIADGAYGRYIDILPARGREERSWADGVLNEPVYSKLRESRCLPDLDGQLRSPNSLRRIPSETIGDWADEWREVAGLRETWIHPDCTTSTERRSKVDRLMAGNSRPVARVLDWLEAVVAEPTPVNSAAAIEIAAGVAAIGGNTQMDVKDSRIVLLETEQLQRPVQGQCFIRTAATQGGSIFVDSRVTSRPSTLQALEDLGITAFEDGGEMLQLLSDLAAKGTADWDALWIAMRGSGQTAVRDGFDQILRGKASQIVRVRNGKGEWVLPESLYLAGERLKQLKEDGTLLVDGSYHAVDSEILSLLGVRGRPTRDSSREPEKWFRSYMKILISTVGDSMSLGIQAREKLQLESSSLLRPLECLPAFGSTNKAALTVAIIDSMEDPRVRVTHPSQERAARFIAPEMWWVKEHGIIPTVLGPVPVREAFDPSAETEELAGLLPVVTGVEVSEEMARVLGLRTEISDLDIGGFDRIVRAHVDRDDLAQVGRTYSWWCATHPESAPDMLLVRTQGTWAEVAPSEVAVALSVDAHRGLDQFGIPCVLVETPEDSYNLREFWGCLEGKNLPLTYAYETSAEPVCLVDAYDIFDELDLDDDPEELTLQKCLSISKVAAVPGRPEMRIDCAYAREGNSILVTASGDREILKQVLACLELDDSNEQVDAFLSAIRRKRDSKRMREIRNASDDAERLLAFAGEERLKTLIPRDALKYLENSSAVPPRGAELARLCITMLGVRALERVCKVDPHGLAKTPPSSWQGSYLTRNWVRELGFSDDWAGQKGRKRNKPTEYVDGPTQLKPLHDYQDAVSKRLRDMLIGTGPRRGIISLPTGAGKTRVAVQTIIEAIESGDLDRDGEPFLGPILWLADGEELCEQAIDAWSFLWRAKGRQDTQLVLSRYWSNYEIEEELGGVQVVIATWQKISRSAVSNTDFAWLSDSPIVVIDEAHGALHPSYTGILAWAGRSDPSGDKALLGLTATPFRGRRDSDESKRLLRRFADNILDADVFGGESAQLRLQRDEVLARARLEILHGVDVDLSTEELEEFRVKFWMPRNAETRLGRNEERTQIIFDSIMGKPDAWPIVVFATSVENAQTLATLLTLAGRPAASIDKDTSPEDRRTAIDRFKSGELRVLTNYAVLSQGFDAPMTRAVYITRPTTSEVRYQQMIGRGLRGPRNGGSDEVLIVNVLDNVVEFADSITFDSLKEIIQEDGGS
ncbi:DEAD/DEAH box helicase [Rhodococcus erythropolis]|uniref:DEAD/DEAH box helicase n=1 Tax=Rhodococcus erythropolis TaxID=1833 RepID=UPI00083FD144|nr:DEAD/DEAH box helicase family protein [Rhodococcus erythropolis]